MGWYCNVTTFKGERVNGKSLCCLGKQAFVMYHFDAMGNCMQPGLSFILCTIHYSIYDLGSVPASYSLVPFSNLHVGGGGGGVCGERLGYEMYCAILIHTDRVSEIAMKNNYCESTNILHNTTQMKSPPPPELCDSCAMFF